MTNYSFVRKTVLVAILTVTLVACGGGGDTSSNPPTSTTQNVITGAASKGTLRNALITAYQITADGQKGSKLSETQTDSSGAYTLKINDYAGAVLLEMTGDGNTTMLCDIPTGCENGKAFGTEVPANFTMQSVLPELLVLNNVAITPFTHLATQYGLKNGLTKTNIDKAFTQIQDLFGLPNLQLSVVSDITGVVADDLDIQRYTLMNAAIGQLAGRVDKIADKLNAITVELIAKNGQLQNSEAGLVDTKIDLADILKAAIAIANDSRVAGKISPITKAALAADLARAQMSQTLTNAQPSDNAGATDLAKAKAFMQTTGNLATTLRQYDDQSLTKSLESKTKSIQALTDGDVLIADALHSSIILLLESALDTTISRSYTYIETQKFLDKFVNTSTLYVKANSNITLKVDVTAHTVTLNGLLTIQPKLKTALNTLMNDGPEQPFNIVNLKAIYPDANTVSTHFDFKINPLSKIKTSDLELGFSGSTDSLFTFDFTTAASLKDHITALNTNNLNAPNTPNSIQATVNNVVLTASKAATTEINKFAGSLQLTLTESALETTNSSDIRKWPTPALLNLTGDFSSPAGDSLTASTTVTFDKNPKLIVSPENGHFRPNLYSYQYKEADKSIYLTTNIGVFSNYYWSQDTALKITLSDKFCSFDHYYLTVNDNIYLTCTNKSNVIDAYKEAITLGAYSDWFTNTYINQEGTYRPQYPVDFNYATTIATSINGTLNSSDNFLYENSTHFTIAALSLTTKMKLLGKSASDVEAQISAKRTDFKNGEYMANFRIGNDKIVLKSLNINNNPEITLINKDNVGVDIDMLNKEKTLEIKINGKVLGHIYKLGGLPVAKFIDNSIKAL